MAVMTGTVDDAKKTDILNIGHININFLIFKHILNSPYINKITTKKNNDKY